MPSFSLENQVAIVTGASSGLGAHFAKVLAEAGAKVALLARRKRLAEEVAAELKSHGWTAAAFAADITDRDSLHRCTARRGRRARPAGHPRQQCRRPCRPVRARSECSRLEHRHRDQSQQAPGRSHSSSLSNGSSASVRGVVVNIASILGVGVSPGVMSYAVSKAAVIQMTKALALEWARYGIRVNALAPGYFPTDLTKDFLASREGEATVKRIPIAPLGAVRGPRRPIAAARVFCLCLHDRQCHHHRRRFISMRRFSRCRGVDGSVPSVLISVPWISHFPPEIPG